MNAKERKQPRVLPLLLLDLYRPRRSLCQQLSPRKQDYSVLHLESAWWLPEHLQCVWPFGPAEVGYSSEVIAEHSQKGSLPKPIG